MQFHRLVQRTGPRFAIRVDDRDVEVQQGDLVITAILLHQQAVRRFEFADTTRAGFCLMAACQDCWVRDEQGHRIRACSTPAQDGMRILTTAQEAEWARLA